MSCFSNLCLKQEKIIERNNEVLTNTRNRNRKEILINEKKDKEIESRNRINDISMRSLYNNNQSMRSIQSISLYNEMKDENIKNEHKSINKNEEKSNFSFSVLKNMNEGDKKILIKEICKEMVNVIYCNCHPQSHYHNHNRKGSNCIQVQKEDYQIDYQQQFGIENKNLNKTYNINSMYNSYTNQNERNESKEENQNIINMDEIDYEKEASRVVMYNKLSSNNIHNIDINRKLNTFELTPRLINSTTTKAKKNTNIKSYNDIYSCIKCEIIYKNAIMNGNPLKSTFQCSYCQNNLNENSLRFYEMKYSNYYSNEKEKKENTIYNNTKIRNINSLNYNQNLNYCSTYSYSISNSVLSNTNTSIYKVNQMNKLESPDLSSCSYTDSESDSESDIINNKSVNQIEIESNRKGKQMKIPKKVNKLIEKKDNYTLNNNNNSMKDKEKEQLLIFPNDNYKKEKESNNQVLSDIFHKKKKDLIEKMKNREYNTSDLNEKYKIQLNIKKEPIENKINSSKNIPLTLINRLIKGEKVVMTNKEMKDLNKRMVSRLPEYKSKSMIKDYEIRRKEDVTSRKRNMMKYGNKIKENVVKNK